MNCAYYINNIGGQTIQYDGLTTVLTAWAKVIPNQVYSFKIAIGDAGDGIFDSGVFLEANSFSSNAVVVETGYSVVGAGKTAIEGCNNAIIKFSLIQPHSTNYWVKIDSIYGTATNGVDFPKIPDSIMFAPGQMVYNLVIAPYIDGITEGIEYLKMRIKTSACTWDSIVIPIADYTPVTMTKSPNTATCQGSVPLWVLTKDGHPPYKYKWIPSLGLNNDTISNPTATPSVTTTYYVYVKDTTACPAIKDSVKVTVVPPPVAKAGSNAQVCAGSSKNSAQESKNKD